MKLLHKVKTALFGAVAFIGAFFSTTASAALIDPLVFDPLITGIESDIGLVGAALIGLALLGMSIKWVKATIFS